jgi:hypothetical protein
MPHGPRARVIREEGHLLVFCRTEGAVANRPNTTLEAIGYCSVAGL